MILKKGRFFTGGFTPLMKLASNTVKHTGLYFEDENEILLF